MIDFPGILRAAGLTVVEEGDWQNRAHPGDFSPIGIMWHHTAGLLALGVVIKGRADLAGPLCALYLDQEGVYHVISGGVAWHAGVGSAKVLADLRAGIAPAGYAKDLGLKDDSSEGNHVFIGIEVEARGNGSVYPPVQVRSLVLGSAALGRALNIPETSMIHHREWTARKPDMDLADVLDLRALVRAELAPPGEPGVKGDDMRKILVIDAPGRPKALVNDTASPGERLARPFAPNEWTAFWRAYALGTDAAGKATGEKGWRDPDLQIVIENRPVEEYDALTGYQS